MAEHVEAEHSFLEKITEKFSGHSSSSSDSDDDKSSSGSLKSKVYRLFGRQTPVHKVLGGGKPADILLWRDKKLSASVLAAATAIWVLFELVEYHLLTLVCHAAMASLAILFVWSNISIFLHRAPPKIPDLRVPEKCSIEVSSALRFEVNRGIAVLREIASGRDLKKFFAVIACLWILSIVGSCCNFITLLYINVILLFTVPLFYEKYEDQVDSFGEKAMTKMKKQFAVFDHKVLSKIPRGPMKERIWKKD